MSRLGITAVRLKFKGIDGGPHKQRSVWFNLMICEEFYLGLICLGISLKGGSVFGSFYIGVVWLLLVCVVRCWVKSCNECNPRPVLYFYRRLPRKMRRKVGMMLN